MRRLAGLLLTTLLLAASVHAPSHAQGKELLLFNWSNYISPDLLKKFQAETGIKVTLDTYDTNESMMAKLQAGGGGYDVVVPTGPTLQTMIRDGLVQKIDADKMPNFRNVRKPFDNPNFDPGRLYSVPYMWGTTGLAYDSAKVPGGKMSDSWKELFEPQPEFVGKIGMLTEVGDVISAAAFYLGFDVCTANPAEGQKILDLLEKQKPAVKVYSSEGTADRLGNGDVAMQLIWNGAFHRAHKKLPSLVYIYPKEGVGLWGDNLAVPKGAPHVENAKLFLNFMMDPKNAAEASNFTGYNNAINGSDAYLDPSLRDDPAVNTPEDMVSRLHPGHECSKAALDMRQKIWTRLMR
jgi:spermidine/putrescine transport system substrate-binding protein